MLYAKEQVVAFARRATSHHLLPDAPDPLNLLSGRTGEALQAQVVWFTPFEPLMTDDELRDTVPGWDADDDFERRLLARKLGVFVEVTLGGESQRFYRLRQTRVRTQMGTIALVGRQRSRFCLMEHRWTLMGAHDHTMGGLVEIDLDLPTFATV